MARGQRAEEVEIQVDAPVDQVETPENYAGTLVDQVEAPVH